jgi:serine protease Do
MKDKNNDLAILEINNFSTLEFELNKIPFSIGDMQSAKVGQEVFTLGFPLGSILGSTAKLSTGKINSLYGIDDNPSLLQIGNPLQPGNSGGPLFNMQGELVGVVVSGLNAKYYY